MPSERYTPMKWTLTCVVFSLPILASCYGPYFVRPENPYGKVQPFDLLHTGVDFLTHIGTPVIAPADGVVNYTGARINDYYWSGGLYVQITHLEDFHSLYAHLSAVHVERGQSVKRGQLLGLSGATNGGLTILHFGVCRLAGSCWEFSGTFDPGAFWLGGRPQCFDPAADYARRSPREITVRLACGKHARDLLDRIKR
jgi:hypothetical protein